jgi:O-antigen ligase
MSLAVPRRAPAAAAPAVASEPADIARVLGWCVATVIIFTAVYFHSKTDPGIRFLLRNDAAANYGPAWWDQQKFGPFTPGDLTVIAFAYVGLVARFHSRRLSISTRTATLIGVGGIAVVMGIAAGIYHSTPSPFGDWRYLAIGLLFAFGLWSTIVRTERDCLRLAQIFVAIVGLYAVYQLIEYAAGTGEIAFYGRTTTGDHATLEFMVAAVGISMAMLRTGRTRVLWWLGIAAGTAVVVLAFRRYAWVELVMVFAVFVVFSGVNRRKYLLSIVTVAVAGAVAVGLTWSSLDWGGRISSLNPTETRAQNIYATTNEGHINDILDGLDEARAHPITGLGVGVLYHGRRTALWKGDAGMVHNAPIEVWIKFGLLGLGVFLATYYILFRDIWRRRRRGRVSDLLAFGAGSFFIGQAVVMATVYPWPFATWENGILVFTVIAMAFPPTWRVPAASPSEARS